VRAPDPKAFDSALERLNTMLTNWPGWSHDQLRAISAPTHAWLEPMMQAMSQLEF
jgi:hypothetical protein